MANFEIIGVSPSTKDVYLTGPVDIMLKNAAAISEVPEDCVPGSFAATADYSYMARKGLDGEWHQIGGGASNA